MRVLAYAPRYIGQGHDAGSEITLHAALKALADSDHDVTVLLAKHPKLPSKPYYIDGIFVVPEMSPEDLNERLRETDVLFLQHSTTDRGVFAAKIAGVPVVQMVHNELEWSAGYLAMGVDLAVYNSEHVKKTMEEDISAYVKVPIDESSFALRHRRCWNWDSCVLYPPVDPEDYRTDSARTRVTLINLNEDKGAELFYELARRMPYREFLGVKGAYGEQLIPEVITGNVAIMEHTPEIRSVYSLTSVLLMPSKRESFGRTAIEAAASGIPTIHSGTPGLIESTGHYGIPLDKPEDWHFEIERVLHQYDDHSRWALERSKELWEITQDQLNNFVSKVEGLVVRSR